ncbi:MAG: hypothetical protein WBO95_16175, partial [Candidatus Dechloromonas phosphoritropha]
PTGLRPFVCDGSPRECQAFSVGFNPATTLSADFWEFWRTDYGFDKAAWLEAYKKDRQDRPLRPKQKRRNLISTTRRVLDWMSEAASPIRCLETNIYSAPTEQAADLAFHCRVTTPFDFLLAALRPNIIVAHGDDAVAYLQQMKLSAQVIPVSHLSRGWSREAAAALGQKVKTACANAQPIIPPDLAHEAAQAGEFKR